MSKVTAADFDAAASMEELYTLLARRGIENGWNKPEPSLWPLPNREFVPAHWAYREAKAALNAAGRFVNTELAERRNLILANPIEGNKYPTVKTLICAYQMVKAGETVHTISQFHGIQLDALAKLNHLQPGESPQPGDLLSLRWQLNDEGELPWLARVRNC